MAGGLLGLFLLLSASAFANNILVSEDPWGHAAASQYNDANNMTNVFGGNFQQYGSYEACLVGTPPCLVPPSAPYADPTQVFVSTNQFVFLEGGDSTTGNWESYIQANSAAILNWVIDGGTLLLQAAPDTGSALSSFTFGPGTFNFVDDVATDGYLTTAGSSAFTFEAPSAHQVGNPISNTDISGAGLTVFMNNGDNTPGPPPGCTSNCGGFIPGGGGGSAGPNSANNIVAGTAYGSGYIMYSTLTDSFFNGGGSNLAPDPSQLDSLIAYTAAQSTVPEPGTTVLMFGPILLGVAKHLRKKLSRA
jgi:hypothetical protein